MWFNMANKKLTFTTTTTTPLLPPKKHYIHRVCLENCKISDRSGESNEKSETANV